MNTPAQPRVPRRVEVDHTSSSDPRDRPIDVWINGRFAFDMDVEVADAVRVFMEREFPMVEVGGVRMTEAQFEAVKAASRG